MTTGNKDELTHDTGPELAGMTYLNGGYVELIPTLADTCNLTIMTQRSFITVKLFGDF